MYQEKQRNEECSPNLDEDNGFSARHGWPSLKMASEGEQIFAFWILSVDNEGGATLPESGNS